MTYQHEGRRIRRSTGRTRKKEAEAVLAKAEVEVFEGTHFPERLKGRQTVGELRDRWLAHVAHKRSLRDDERRFVAIVDALGKPTPIGSLTAKDIDALVKTLRETRTRLGRPMAEATINRHLALLRSALNLAKREGLLRRSPMEGYRLLREDNERDRICSPEEYEALVAASQGNLQLAIVLGYQTGMRLGEIAALDWKQIDLRARVIVLRPGDTKSGEGRRVPLNAAAVAALKAQVRRLDGRVLTATRGSLSPQFARLVRKLELEDLHFHDLRHTCATRLRRAGVDVLTIQRITGHKTLDMLRRYNQVTDEDLLGAVDAAAGVERG